MTTVERTLHHWGRVDWDAVRAIIGTVSAAWADYDGFQIGPCPDMAPPYSHLWAWVPDHSVLLRIRIDGADGIASALTTGPLGAGVPEASGARSVLVQTHPGLPWGTDGQIGRQAEDLLRRIKGITMFETLEPDPMTFVAVDLLS